MSRCNPDYAGDLDGRTPGRFGQRQLEELYYHYLRLVLVFFRCIIKCFSQGIVSKDGLPSKLCLSNDLPFPATQTRI